MDFSGKKGKEIMRKGIEAKFTQHSELRDMLLATNNATLKQYISKSPSKLSCDLMKVRKNLRI